MRYFIHFCYDGTNYHGWQIQPNGNTVQAELQRACSLALRQDVTVVGAGRTDTGVHARHMVAHFDIGRPIDCAHTAFRLNNILPRDIAVDRVEEVPGTMHARFSAKRRTYHYYVHTAKEPFRDKYSLQLHYHLNYEMMNRAAAVLTEYNDFGAFCKAGSDVKTTLCDVVEAGWHHTSPTNWHFRITADRFLRNMVRAVVGTLVEVGRGRLSVEEFRQVIEGKSRSQAGESMPAKALFMESVEY